MTKQDQSAAIGRLVTRYSEAKARRAALLAEGQDIGESLGRAADALRRLDWITAFWDGRPDGHARTTADFTLTQPYAAADRVTTLLNDLRAVSAELRELRGLMKDAGVSLD